MDVGAMTPSELIAFILFAVCNVGFLVWVTMLAFRR